MKTKIRGIVEGFDPMATPVAFYWLSMPGPIYFLRERNDS